MVFEYADVASLIGWIVIVSWQRWPMTMDDITWYERESLKLRHCRVPSPIFPIVWTLLHALVIASQFSYFKLAAASAGDVLYVTTFALSIANLLLAQAWTFLFFKMRRIISALIVAILLVLTAVAVCVLMGVSHGIVGSLWPLPVALYIPYIVWLVFAVILNSQWAMLEPRISTETRRKSKK